jgi:energy-coupling factor transport system substrate-specific component
MRKGVATTAILIALAVAVGMIVLPVPNVEGVSAVSFFSGYLAGWRTGGLVGAMAMLLRSLLNPLGPAPPPVLAAQVAGMAVVGSSGFLLRRLGPTRARAGLWAAASGALVTLFYDALTNYGVAVSMGRWSNPAVVMLAGVPFAAIHVTANAMIFGAVAAIVARKHWFRTEESTEENDE